MLLFKLYLIIFSALLLNVAIYIAFFRVRIWRLSSALLKRIRLASHRMTYFLSTILVLSLTLSCLALFNSCRTKLHVEYFDLDTYTKSMVKDTIK